MNKREVGVLPLPVGLSEFGITEYICRPPLVMEDRFVPRLNGKDSHSERIFILAD